ncbi:MAG: SRPBCC family protein [Candidatus Cohnella colombiensis]|uniref:SRPBCC family protein n=1 Tax=Candidatus Cohnella colombiensis TaxID=3121368 RepID=A0AA95JAP2_9BACL|nr:MAG: SRPBCC family protein [Cohnella sp.]
MPKTDIIAEKGKQEIIITRIFNAPRELVFRTYTDPVTVPEWWGPRQMTIVVDKMEVKKGGIWRYVHRTPDGQEYAHNGVYHEIGSPERIINTYEFEGFPGVVGLVTTTFEEQPGGKTKFTETTLYPSAEVAEAVLQSGMSDGAIELLDRLEELLAKLQA